MKYVVSFLLFFSFNSHSAEFYEQFQNTRQLGMGGVYVFHEHDGSSFLQNPAYTCFVKGFNWSIAGADIGVGDLTNYEFMKAKIESGDTPTGATLSEYFGKAIYIKNGLYTSLSMPCFGFGIYNNVTASFLVENPAYPTINTFYRTDMGIVLGGGVRLGENFSLGLDVKRIQRKGGPATFGPESISLLDEPDGFKNLISSVENGGQAYGIDAGLVARVPAPFNPTVSLSWKDVGSTAFTKTSGTTAPDRQKDNLTLGMTFEQSLLLMGVAGGIEYRHITDNNEQFGKKLHLGAEVSLFMFDLRAGLHQGYTTYGVGMDLWLLQFEAALYSAEKGAYPGQTPEQRAQIGLLIDMQFDANFNLVDTSGKRRRLKQRR